MLESLVAVNGVSSKHAAGDIENHQSSGSVQQDQIYNLSSSQEMQMSVNSDLTVRSAEIERCSNRMISSVMTEPGSCDELQGLFDLHRHRSKQLDECKNELLKLLHEEWSITGIVPDDYERLCNELGQTKNLLKNTSYPISRFLVHSTSLMARGKRDYNQIGTVKYATMAANRRRVDTENTTNCGYLYSHNTTLTDLSNYATPVNRCLSGELIFDTKNISNANLYPKETDDLYSDQVTEYSSFLSTDSPTSSRKNVMNQSEISYYPDLQSNRSSAISCNLDSNDVACDQLGGYVHRETMNYRTITNCVNHPTDRAVNVNETAEDIERAIYENELKRLELDFAVISQLYSVHKQRAKETKREAYKVAYKSNSKKLKDITLQINHIRSLLIGKDETNKNKACTSSPCPNDRKQNIWSSIRLNLITKNFSVSGRSHSIPSTPNNLTKRSHLFGTQLSSNAAVLNNKGDENNGIDEIQSNRLSIGSYSPCGKQKRAQHRPRHNSILPFFRLFRKHSTGSGESLKIEDSTNRENTTPLPPHHRFEHTKHKRGLNASVTMGVEKSYSSTRFDENAREYAKTESNALSNGVYNLCYSRIRRVHTMPTNLMSNSSSSSDHSSRSRSSPDLHFNSQQEMGEKFIQNPTFINQTQYITQNIHTTKHHSDSTGYSSGTGLMHSIRSINSSFTDSNPIPTNAVCLKHIPKRVTNSNTSSNWSTSGCSSNSSQKQPIKTTGTTTKINTSSLVINDFEEDNDDEAVSAVDTQPGINTKQTENLEQAVKLTNNNEVERVNITVNQQVVCDQPKLRCPEERGRRNITNSLSDNIHPFGIGITAKCICSCFSEYNLINQNDANDILEPDCCHCRPTINSLVDTIDTVESTTTSIVDNTKDGGLSAKAVKKTRNSLTPYTMLKRAVSRMSTRACRHSITNTQSTIPVLRKTKRVAVPTILPTLTTDRQIDLIKPIIQNKQQLKLCTDKDVISKQIDFKANRVNKFRYSLRPVHIKTK